MEDIELGILCCCADVFRKAEEFCHRQSRCQNVSWILKSFVTSKQMSMFSASRFAVHTSWRQSQRGQKSASRNAACRTDTERLKWLLVQAFCCSVLFSEVSLWLLTSQSPWTCGWVQNIMPSRGILNSKHALWCSFLTPSVRRCSVFWNQGTEYVINENYSSKLVTNNRWTQARLIQRMPASGIISGSV